MHQALYRKYRPTTFSEVVGQDHITEVLRYEVAAGKTCHAYLFCGSRGTGKTTCAKILAKAVNCLSNVNGDPCGVCAACRAVDAGTTDILEMDAASNTGVDYIRDIREEVRYAPSQLSGRVYIIDEVHMLTDSAFNALLKTLEEPPAGVTFILATTEMQKIPATILSRCQRFDFRRIRSDVISARLQHIAKEEGIDLTEDAAHSIARIAEGGMRDAISLLELCSSANLPVTDERVAMVSGNAGNATVVKTVRAILDRDAARLFEIVADLYGSSLDISSFWLDLQRYYRDMLAYKASVGMDREKFRTDILDVTEHELSELGELSERFRYETLLYHCQVLESAFLSGVGKGPSKRLSAEMALLRLVEKPLETTVEALLQRVSALEDALLSGVTVQVPKKTADAVPSVAKAPTASESVAKQSEAFKKPTGVLRALKHYPEIVKAFANAEPTCAAFLVDAKGYFDGEKTVIRLENGFHKTMLESRDAAHRLQILIQNIEGIDAEVVFEKCDRQGEQKDDLSDLFSDEYR